MERRNADLLLGVVLVLLAVGLDVYIRTQPWYRPEASIIDDSSFFPLAACRILFLLSLFHLFKTWKSRPDTCRISVNGRGLVLVLLWTVYALCLDRAGFLLAGWVVLSLSQLLCGERRWKPVLSIGFGLPLFLYVVLGKLLGVSFPQGIIFF